MRKNSSTSGWSALAAKNCFIRGVCAGVTRWSAWGGPDSLPEAAGRLVAAALPGYAGGDLARPFPHVADGAGVLGVHEKNRSRRSHEWGEGHASQASTTQ